MDIIRNGFFVYLFIEKMLELRMVSQIIDLSLCIGVQEHCSLARFVA